MNELEYYSIKKFVDECKIVELVLNGSQKFNLKLLISSLETSMEEFTDSKKYEKIAFDKTNIEIGLFWANANKIIKARLIKYFPKDFKKISKTIGFGEAVKNTKFSDEVINIYISFSRKFKFYGRNLYAAELAEQIRILIFNEFLKYNKINNYE